MLRLTCMFLCVLGGQASNQAKPDAAALCREVIGYRLKNVASGRVRFTVVSEGQSAPQGEVLFDLAFDRARVRQRRKTRADAKSQWGQAETVIVTPDVCIDDVSNTDKAVALTIRPPDAYKNARKDLKVLNVQALGMVFGGTAWLHARDVESLLNSSPMNPRTVDEDKVAGTFAWRIEYTPVRSGETVRQLWLWVDPKRGPSLLKARQLLKVKDASYVHSIDSLLETFPSGNVWYPRRVVSTLETNGRVIDQQVVRVEEATFGEKLENTLFDVESLSLEAGRRAIDARSGRPVGKVWNGTELVDPTAPGSATQHTSLWRRWLLVILAVGLGILGGYRIWRVLATKAQTAS